MLSKLSIIIVCLIYSSLVLAAQTTVKIYSFNEPKQLLGKVIAKDTRYGLLLLPNINGLAPGGHGFHLHVYPSCKNTGNEAGGHFDPKHTHRHLGPYNENGHLGDLPLLYVNSQGQATVPELAPRLTVAQIKGHSLIILADSDDYKDTPQKRSDERHKIACGVVNVNNG